MGRCVGTEAEGVVRVVVVEIVDGGRGAVVGALSKDVLSF